MKTRLFLVLIALGLLVCRAPPARADTLAWDENGNTSGKNFFFSGNIVGGALYVLPFTATAGTVFMIDPSGETGDGFTFVDLGFGPGDMLAGSVANDSLIPDSDMDFAGLPATFGGPTLLLPETGTEGANGLIYTPAPGQPGYDPSGPTYVFHSDGGLSSPVVPEIDAGLLASACTVLGGGVLMLRGRRRKKSAEYQC